MCAVMYTVLPFRESDGVVVVRLRALRLQFDEPVQLFDGISRNSFLCAQYFPQEEIGLRTVWTEIGRFTDLLHGLVAGAESEMRSTEADRYTRGAGNERFPFEKTSIAGSGA